MEIRVNATRMELLKLKKKGVLARRGHKLLKDKLDGLVQHFIQTSKKIKKVYANLREELIVAFAKGALARAEGDRLSLSAALVYPTIRTEVSENLVNLMGVKIPEYVVKITGNEKCFGNMFFTDVFVETLSEFKELLPKMVELGQYYKTMQRMGREIVEIKRRVNALEYILIPEIESKVEFIRMKLAEIERGNIVTLLKIKEIVQEKR